MSKNWCAECKYYSNKINKEPCLSCKKKENDYIPINFISAKQPQPKDINYEQDNVNHPSHYNTGNIEVYEYIQDKLTKEELEGYLTGNIMKYISRYRHKNGVEDLKKANWYLDKLIHSLEVVK